MKQMAQGHVQLQMRGLLAGFVVSRALQAAAELGVADHGDNRSGRERPYAAEVNDGGGQR